MKPKPGHLGLKYAEQFKDTSVVKVYHHRLPYADEAINKLITLVIDEPRTILDVGCGTGDLARRLVSQVERVDAVDFSPAMIDKGKTLPEGDNHNLNWISGRMEEVELHPPYALITAGESLHWMEWDIVLPLFHRLLTPHGYLALITRETEHNPWDNRLQELINHYSTNQEYLPYDLVEELEQRHLFQPHGFLVTQPIPMKQSGEDYLQSFHSRNGFSRERMGEEAATVFDEMLFRLFCKIGSSYYPPLTPSFGDYPKVRMHDRQPAPQELS
ncbi:MAG: class I SAM-dependent methyltransferase [Ktedonobacteraceae bacterium]